MALIWSYGASWWSDRLFAAPGTVARQAPLSMKSSRQECWSGWPFPSPGDLPGPGLEPGSLPRHCHGRQGGPVAAVATGTVATAVEATA